MDSCFKSCLRLVGMVLFCLCSTTTALWGQLDLAVQSVAVDPPYPILGETMEVAVVVQNVGTLATPTNTAAIELASDGGVLVYIVPPLDSGEMITLLRYSVLSSPSNYWVRGYADYAGDIIEDSETNNVAERSVWVSSGADLVIDSLTVSNAVMGQTNGVTGVIRNAGVRPSGTNRVVLTVDGSELQYVMSPLDAQETFTFYRMAVYETNGTVLVSVSADHLDEVVELSESNNVATTNLYVSSPFDLAVQSVTVEPPYPILGETMEVAVAIQNVGTLATPTNTAAIELASDGGSLVYIVPPLNSGETITLLRYSVLNTPSNYWVRGYADYEGEIIEESETNNVAERPVWVSSGADLVIDSLTVSNAVMGHTNVVTGVIRNAGIRPSGTNRVVLTVDGSELHYVMPPVGTNDVFTFFRTVVYETNGTVSVSVRADDLDELVELNETNNVAVTNLVVTSPYDLAVESLTVTPELPILGEMTEIALTVKNVGVASTPTNYAAIEHASDSSPTLFEIAPLLPGATTTVSRTATINTPSNFLIRGYADYAGEILEESETNNVAEQSVWVSSGAELFVTSVVVSNTAVGETNEVQVSLVNAGVRSAGASYVRVTYNDEASPVLLYVPPLNAGSFFTVSRSEVHSTAEQFDVLIELDYDKSVLERYEDNNSVVTNFQVTASYDLELESITVDPPYPILGETATVSVVVHNVGEVASDLSRVGVRVGTNLPSSYLVPALGVGARRTQWLMPVMSQASGVVIRAEADYTDVMLEQDEANNVLEKTVWVSSGADLVVDSLTASNGVVGVTNTVELAVRNTGVRASLSNEVVIAIDGDAVTYALPALATNEVAVLQRDYLYTTSGVFTVVATLDPLGTLLELDEANNMSNAVIEVMEANDLQISSLTIAQSYPIIGETTDIHLTIENVGSETVSNFYAALELPDDHYPYMFWVDALAPGTNLALVRSHRFLRAGSVTVTGWVDFGEHIPESNETNNFEAAWILPSSGANLMVDGVSWWPRAPLQGEAVRIEAMIRNVGIRDAATSRHRVMIDGAMIDDGFVVSGLATNESVMMTQTGVFESAGLATVGVEVDYVDDEPEYDELDNVTNVVVVVEGDQDQDGLADSWESIYYGDRTIVGASDDTDGDGATAYEEFVAGTIPTNAASVFKLSLWLTNGVPVVGYSTIADRFYSLEQTTNLPGGSWQYLRYRLEGSGPETSTYLSTNSPSAVFRVLIERQ